MKNAAVRIKEALLSSFPECPDPAVWFGVDPDSQDVKWGWWWNDGSNTAYLGRNLQDALKVLGAYEWEETNANDGPTGTIYLLHFDRPMTGKKMAQHYLGWTKTVDPDPRLLQHQAGKGSAIMREVMKQGIGFTVVRTWTGTKKDERAKKNSGHLSRYCPICKAAGVRQQKRGKHYEALKQEAF